MIGVCSGLSATHNVETALFKAKATIQHCFQRDVLAHQRRGRDSAIPDAIKFTTRLYSLRKNARLVAPASCRLSRGRPALGISRRDAGATSFVLGHGTWVPSRCHLGAIVYAPPRVQCAPRQIDIRRFPREAEQSGPRSLGGGHLGP